MQNTMGYTLGEVAVTLAVMAVLATVGVPAMGNFVADYRLTRAANLLTTDLNHARTAAISGHQRVVACPSADMETCLTDGNWDQGWMVFIDRNDQGFPASTADILRINQSDSRLTIRSGARHRVRYLDNGSAAGSTITLVICDHRGLEKARRVIVSNPGRVRTDGPPTDRGCDGIS